jgi:hypothetical protein
MYEEKSEEACVYFHDILCNKYSFPVDSDEKHCFDRVFDDDFAIDEDISSYKRKI